MIVSRKIAFWLGISSIAVLGIGESALAQSEVELNSASSLSPVTGSEPNWRSLDGSATFFSNIAQGGSVEETIPTERNSVDEMTPTQQRNSVDESFPNEVETQETEVEVEPDTSEVEIEDSQVEVEEPETDSGSLSDIFTSGQNYLGVGGSLGFIEDAYGDFGAFAAISKLKLFTLTESNDVSIRPSVLVGSDVTFVVPFTLDINIGSLEDAEILGRRFVPYGGPGFTFTTDTDVFYFTLTGGLDIPFEQFTINTEVNVGFLDDIALGAILGIGYNF
ncbi:hypothetical protein [Myxosarcina sp. GI1]|uniref:hypothetical protein n=1 Tax=Myxosarcina sp. GI1 TaxID=1541065 RepID=UPI00068ACD51|nr:hypothetical protein [Myxosarcina sp. GI1]